MPVIQSAKKQMRQSLKKRMRNFPVRNQVKTFMKKVLLLVKEGKAEELKIVLAEAYSVIDTACKKNIIHPNNAARKKSRLAREVNALIMKSAGGGRAEEKVKA